MIAVAVIPGVIFTRFFKFEGLNRRLLSFFGCWLLGLLLGTLLAVGADASMISLMRRAANCRVSIVLLLTAVLPFLISAYAVSIYRYSILSVLGLLKAFAYSFCGILSVRAFGSAGWLVQPMLQFTDSITTIFLCFFGIRCCVDQTGFKRDLIICILVSVAAVIIDYALVSPYLLSLM